jgi:hypothetical protein
MAEAGAKRHFSSTSNFSCTLVCFVFQFVGKDIFWVSRATFFLFVGVIVCYLRASPHNSSTMVSTLHLLVERERERERGLFSCSVREGGENWNTYWLRIDLTHWQQQTWQKTSTHGAERSFKNKGYQKPTHQSNSFFNKAMENQPKFCTSLRWQSSIQENVLCRKLATKRVGEQ